MIEMRQQGQLEMELGLPISPMCNPKDNTPLCVGQIGFYNFVAGPLMRQLCGFFGEAEGCLIQFESNLTLWTRMKNALGSQNH
jgi:hypothetical protein